MSAPVSVATNRWAGVWADMVAFVGGLALAWFSHWQTTDLVWSLWLSSFVVGYALIVWTVSAPLREVLSGMSRDGSTEGASPLAKTGVIGLFGVGTLFGLAFFTVHFGGFHYVHSVFLNSFFPIAHTRGFPGWPIYLEVLRRYWVFLPLAFLAERSAFKRASSVASAPDISVTAEAIARRKAQAGNSGMMVPYQGVLRMHLLIFFFAFAHFAKLENFAVYAVVYAVYFFPWRVLRSAPLAPAEG